MPFSQRPTSCLPIESQTIWPWNDLDWIYDLIYDHDLIYDLDFRQVKPS